MVLDAVLSYILGGLMDLIRFPPSSGTNLVLSNAKLVEGWDSLTWIERYRDSGEFTIKADASSHIRDDLPVGALISHLNTPELMIVENHEIQSEEDDVDKVTITGRSFEVFLEQRIVGCNRNWAAPVYPMPDFILTADKTWVQAERFINQHIFAGYDSWDLSNGITNVMAYMKDSLRHANPSGFVEDRSIPRGEVYKQLIDILAIDSLGIKSSRPCSLSVLADPETGSCPEILALEIHIGTNKTDKISFSHEFGDIESGNYLQTSKSDKNAALVVGKFVEVPVYEELIVGFDRRWMVVDGSDIDGQFSEAPTGGDLLNVRKLMTSRGKQALTKQNPIEIVNPKIIKTSNHYKYREDYNVGDLVSVNGEYNSNSIQRVIEFVEIEDDEGEVGYPTFSEP